jgi:hypothetical protein
MAKKGTKVSKVTKVKSQGLEKANEQHEDDDNMNTHKELTNVYKDLDIKIDNKKSNKVVYYDKNNIIDEDETQLQSKHLKINIY